MMIGLSRFFPQVQVKSSMDKQLKLLGIEPERYMGMSLLLSFFFMVAAFALFPEYYILPLGFGASFAFFLMLPGIETGRKKSAIESELPFFLRNTGMLIEIGVPFQQAIEKGAGEGALKQEISIAMNQVRNGIGIRKALAQIAVRLDSFTIKRAISQIITTYEIGGSGRELRRMGDELLSVSQHKMKEYGSKSAMFGLLFIMSSAILPTFFLVYAIAGRFIFNSNIGNIEIAIAMLVIFPLISAMIMLVSKSAVPQSAFARGGFDPMMLVPGMVFVSGFLFAPDFQMLSFALGSAVAGYIIYSTFKKERKTEEIESRLPDALFSVSGLPKSVKPHTIFSIIEDADYGALSEEAGKSASQISMNVALPLVIEDLWKRNGSPMLKKTCEMLGQMINTNALDRLNLLAEDILTNTQIRREQAQLFSMQKYTLLLGGLIIPLILKMALYLLGSMSELLGDMGDVIGFSESIIPPYLMIYSTICAASIAEAEGKRSSAAFYFLMLSVASLAIFYLMEF